MTQKAVLHNELCDKALAHYEALSRKTAEWHSVIPNAIEFYRKFGRHFRKTAKEMEFENWKKELSMRTGTEVLITMEQRCSRLDLTLKKIEHLTRNALKICNNQPTEKQASDCYHMALAEILDKIEEMNI